MITLNDKKYAESASEFIDSLFHSKGTCVGYAKRRGDKIELCDHQRKFLRNITDKEVK